jgi:hypothetical protein
MGLFDYFKKKHKQENTDKKPEIVEESTISYVKQPTTSIYDGISVDGEVLKKVYSQNIQNGTFIVPEYIKSIGWYAFSNLKNLHAVIMHEGVRFVCPFAFHGCDNLMEIKGLENAETMKTIDGYQDCANLKSIKLPQTTTTIANAAFRDCTNLTSINIPDGCWFISAHAFAGCENLQTIEIPASVELVETSAFAGCKNLTITFLDDDKKYLQDVIKEQQEIEKQYLEEMGVDFNLDEIEYPEEEIISNEDKKALYDDLGVKYRETDILGHKILWAHGKIIIKPDALAGVKEVIAYNQDTIQTIMKSGYEGKITLVDREKQETITIDIPTMKEYQKELISQAREEYYKQTLIPSGGTLNWLLNCEKRKYKCGGYTNDVVCDIPISSDSHISVTDHLQPISNTRYSKEYEEFCTSVTFFKKELDNHSVHAPYEYERSYCVYYPYGARFDKDMLLQIGTALSGLIDKARDLPNSSTSQEQLTQIQSRQKKLIDLLVSGTNNKNAVKEIMQGITIPQPTGQIKEARYKKDWLPDFSKPIFSKTEIKEVEEYRKQQREEGFLSK